VKKWMIVLIGLVIGVSVGVSNAIMEFRVSQPPRSARGPDALVSGADSHPGQARLEVEGGAEFDFGGMEHGSSLSHDFVIRNVGDGPLLLKTGEPTCKCTVTELQNEEVAPGESVEVSLTWNAKSFESEFRQSVPVYSNDPQQQEVTLSVFGRVLQGVQIYPRDIVFSDVRIGEERSTELRLMAYNDAEFDVASFQWEDPDTADHFDAEFSRMDAEEVALEPDAVGGVRGTITIKESAPMGLLNQVLLVQTNDPNREPYEIPIRAKIVSSISVAGTAFNEEINVLRMGHVKQSDGARAGLRVMVTGEHAASTTISVAGVVPEDILRVELGELRRFGTGAVMFPLDVLIPADSRAVNHILSKQESAGRVTINTTHPDAPEISFHVSFAVVK